MPPQNSSSAQDDPFQITQEIPVSENLDIIQATNKKEREVQSFIEQNHLNASKKTVYVLTHGSLVQKTSVLNGLGNALDECSPEDISDMIREMNEAWKQDAEAQIYIGQSLRHVLPRLSPQHVVELQDGIITMIEISNEKVRTEWGNLLVESVAYLPMNELDSILRLALRKTDTEESLTHRAMGCRALGKLATRYSVKPEKIERDFLQHTMDLCQDTNSQIRAEMCVQLTFIARSIGMDLAKKFVMTELEELLRDEEEMVRCAAFTSWVDLLDLFDMEYRASHVLPVLRTYLTEHGEGHTRHLLVEHLGHILHKLQADLRISCNTADTERFARYFVDCSCKDIDPDVRRMCAFNFPAVATSLPIDCLYRSLHVSLVSLSREEDLRTRRSIAAGLHEICQIVANDICIPISFHSDTSGLASADPGSPLQGSPIALQSTNSNPPDIHPSPTIEAALVKANDAFDALRVVFLTLLSDTDMVVREHIVRHLVQFLQLFHEHFRRTAVESAANMNTVRLLDRFAVFPDEFLNFPWVAKVGADPRSRFFTYMIPSLVAYERSIRLRWRWLESFFEAFTLFPRYFTAAQIHDCFLPMLLHHLQDGAHVLSILCARLVVHLTRWSQSNTTIVSLYHRYITTLADAPHYRRRLAFIELCNQTVGVFSRRYCLEQIFAPLVALGKDPVPSVRLRYVEGLVTWGTLLKTPSVTAENIALFDNSVLFIESNNEDVEVHKAFMSMQEKVHTLRKEISSLHPTGPNTTSPTSTVGFFGIKMSKGSSSKSKHQGNNTGGLSSIEEADRRRETEEGDLIDCLHEAEKQNRRQFLRELIKGGDRSDIEHVTSGSFKDSRRGTVGSPTSRSTQSSGNKTTGMTSGGGKPIVTASSRGATTTTSGAPFANVKTETKKVFGRKS